MQLLLFPCNCIWCQDEKKMRQDIYGNAEVRVKLGQVNRLFEAKMIRLGRKYGVPNRRMRRPNLFKEMMDGLFGQ